MCSKVSKNGNKHFKFMLLSSISQYVPYMLELILALQGDMFTHR